MNSDELKKFRTLLLERRKTLLSGVQRMEDEALRHSRQDAAGDLSSMPYHMADIGTDNYEQEFTLSLLESEQEELRSIDEALARVEAGNFGICESCQKKIGKPRLRVLPHCRLCIDCQREEENTR